MRNAITYNELAATKIFIIATKALKFSVSKPFASNNDSER